MATMIAEFVLQNPLTGSGYLGSWIMIDSLSGSAHNQYLDVFFRTGIIGFCCYLWLLYRLLRFLKFNEPSLFWGFVGVLIYGLFHETFKLSQGAFILSFLLGMMVQKRAGTVGAAQVQVRPASPSITVSQEVPPNRGMSAR
jgi:O-antigen ligase